MKFVEIDEVIHTLPQPQLVGASIDLPAAGTHSEVHAIAMTGWALGRGEENRVNRVRISLGAEDIRATPTNLPRADVVAYTNGLPGSHTCGWSTSIGMVGLPEKFELAFDAILPNNVPVRIGYVRGRRRPVRSEYRPSIRPLMLTSFGRTGTTWLMRLLTDHSSIIGYRQHPFEVRPAKYWLHALKILTEPANHFQSSDADGFQYQKHSLGHNPFYAGPLTSHPSLHRFFGQTYPEQLAATFQRTIDSFYKDLAKLQQQPDPIFFCEKFHADRIPAIAWELYPDAREIILVRDFRDVLCSILAFNAKRGFQAFGRERVAGDASYVEHLGAQVDFLRAAWQERSDRALLVRYEELVTRPRQTLGAILEYAGVDASVSTVEAILAKASRETDESRGHRTSASAESSIGRWRTELSAAQREEVDRVLAKALDMFGYASTDAPVASTPSPQPSSRGLVAECIPNGAHVLVVSGGEEAFTTIEGRIVRHFPQTSAGWYPGEDPADSADAISHLESLRAGGAQYLLLPAAAAVSWREQYPEFCKHLEQKHRTVRSDDRGVIYELLPPNANGNGAAAERSEKDGVASVQSGR